MIGLPLLSNRSLLPAPEGAGFSQLFGLSLRSMTETDAKPNGSERWAGLPGSAVEIGPVQGEVNELQW